MVSCVEHYVLEIEKNQPVPPPFLQCRHNLKLVALFRFFITGSNVFMREISFYFLWLKGHTAVVISSLARPNFIG